MAGHGQVCVHVAALLFKIEAAVKLGFTARSSTSEACVWNKQFRSEIEMCSVSDMYEKGLIRSNRKVHVPTVTSSSRDSLPDVEMLQKLKECCPSAVFFTLIPKLDSDETDTADEDDTSTILPLITSIGDEIVAAGQSRTDEEALEVYKRVCVKSAIDELEIRTRIQSKSVLWHLHRKCRITGTSVHDVLHRRPSLNPSKLIKKICGYGSNSISHLPSVSWGSEHEDVAIEKYVDGHKPHHCKFTFRRVGFLIDSDNVYIGASADGIVNCECCGTGVVEVKCPHKHRNVDPLDAAATDKEFCLTAAGDLKITHKYYSQVQLQMHVHKVQYCDFVVFTSISVHVCRILRDDNFLKFAVEKCKSFWMTYVLPEIRGLALEREECEVTGQQNVDVACSCQKPASKEMISCSHANCRMKLYHYACVGLESKPPGRWICEQCRCDFY